jgi:uracil-DNA glycosylase
MKELIQRIGNCNLCEDVRFKNLVNSKSKPYSEFKVYENWLPEGDIKCLFIGESPPGRGVFFYDYRTEDHFRENLFSLLEMNKSGYEGLCDFKQGGFLLIDALKCRVNKKGKSIPKAVINNCLGILELEIKSLARSKNVERLAVLGRIALMSLRMLGFSELEEFSITKNCGKIVNSHGFGIFLCTLPFDRNKKYWNTPNVKEALKTFVKCT